MSEIAGHHLQVGRRPLLVVEDQLSREGSLLRREGAHPQQRRASGDRHGGQRDPYPGRADIRDHRDHGEGARQANAMDIRTATEFRFM